MKYKLSRAMKAITLVMVTLAVVVLGSMGSTIGVKATVVTTDTSGVKYVQYSGLQYSDFWGKKAPEYIETDGNGVGYFFGGWFNKITENEYKPIETLEELSVAETSGTVVAKFVPAQTMSVKCQNWAGTKLGSGNVIVRVISAVDSTNYTGYGFEISKIAEGEETPLGTYTSKDKSEVYSKFKYYENAEDTTPKETYAPSDLFGSAASHFTSCTIGYIPENAHGTIICIKPFWETLDGVKVYGLSKYAHVEDGYLGYVNVPVNLNVLAAGTGAAAGILSVTTGENLTFKGAETGVEYGKVFDEMKINVLDDGTIKCVGYTSDASDKTGMDVYINLKFQRTQSNDAPAKGEFFTFTVGGEDFANSKEEDLTNEDVWNVIY